LGAGDSVVEQLRHQVLEHHGLADPSRTDQHHGPAYLGVAHQGGKLAEIGRRGQPLSSGSIF